MIFLYYLIQPSRSRIHIQTSRSDTVSCTWTKRLMASVNYHIGLSNGFHLLSGGSCRKYMTIMNNLSVVFLCVTQGSTIE